MVQDAVAYQRLLDSIEHLESLLAIQRGLIDVKNGDTQSLESFKLLHSSGLLNLSGSCADLDIEVDDSGIDDAIDDDMIGAFDD